MSGGPASERAAVANVTLESAVTGHYVIPGRVAGARAVRAPVTTLSHESDKDDLLLCALSGNAVSRDNTVIHFDSDMPIWDSPDARTLLPRVLEVRAGVLDEGARISAAWRAHIDRPEFASCAENLAHYLALRRRDLGDIQDELAYWGLSSLGRSEAHVLSNIDAAAATLASIAGVDAGIARPTRADHARGLRMLRSEKRALFGADPGGPKTRVMVTLPAEAASDNGFCADLIDAGADCARINCAHDDAAAWEAMANNVRSAAASAARTCPILMDLGGAKVRVTTAPAAAVRLKRGATFVLSAHDAPAQDALSARCSDPAFVASLRTGATVWVDDGKMHCVVAEVRPGAAVLRVTAVREKGHVLKPGHGLITDAKANLPVLTERDLADLDFVVKHADMVGLSFVQSPRDVRTLQRELAARGRADMPIVLKIETREAVHNLPRLIVAAAGRQRTAVMIARGDLALALGFERLAEIQEEILWLCEAASVPTVWATQVLERLIRKGLPARAETTDAAMAQRAECVMLNKGPYLAQGVRFLEDVLRRMDRHQAKKSARLAALGSWASNEVMAID